MSNNAKDSKGEIPSVEEERINNSAIAYSDEGFDEGDYRDTAYISYIQGANDEYLRHFSQPTEKKVHPVYKGWNSLKLIGRVKDRFQELIRKDWDWTGFYHGWLEGRAEMIEEMKKEWDAPSPSIGEPGTCRWVPLRNKFPEDYTKAIIRIRSTKMLLTDADIESAEGEWFVLSGAEANRIYYSECELLEEIPTTSVEPAAETEKDTLFMDGFKKGASELFIGNDSPPSPPSIQQEASPDGKTLGQILKEARTARRMSVENVLEETGISNEYLRKLEADELANPSASVLWKLAKYYSVDFKPLAIKAGIIIKKPSPPSSALLEEKKEDSLLTLSRWLNGEMIWQEQHVKNGKSQLYKGAMKAFESVAAKILELSASPSPTNLPLEEGGAPEELMERIANKALKRFPKGSIYAGAVAHGAELMYAELQSELSALREEKETGKEGLVYTLRCRIRALQAELLAERGEKAEYRKALAEVGKYQSIRTSPVADDPVPPTDPYHPIPAKVRINGEESWRLLVPITGYVDAWNAWGPVAGQYDAVRREDIICWIDPRGKAVAEGEKERVVAFVNWLTCEDGPYAVMYGDQPMRFCDNDLHEYTAEEIYDLYLEYTNPQK